MESVDTVNASRSLRILGTRGVPASHGGFETFAEQLAVYLVGRGWHVTVYCQEVGSGSITQDVWQGVSRVHIPSGPDNSLATIVFDWKATRHAASRPGLCLTLGYNTAIFCALLRFKGRTNVINMDGIEWSRAKWGGVAKTWFWLNDWAGCWFGNHLVADHPQIKVHLETRVASDKITTIPYGAPDLRDVPTDALRQFGLVPGRFMTVVARAEPENSLLEIVRGFSARPRGLELVVLGKYHDDHPYQQAVKAAAGPEVRFLGAIYDKTVVQALRFHSAAYVHGHQVGGTNPSLVEALGAGNAVIAHDNRFNRWVAGEDAAYFDGADRFAAVLDELLANPHRLVVMRGASRRRFDEQFTWERVLGEYETLLDRWSLTSRAAHEINREGSAPPG